ncbi:MAG: FIVAR domain-containing protein, partial [Sarcina sp.]
MKKKLIVSLLVGSLGVSAMPTSLAVAQGNNAPKTNVAKVVSKTKQTPTGFASTIPLSGVAIRAESTALTNNGYPVLGSNLYFNTSTQTIQVPDAYASYNMTSPGNGANSQGLYAQYTLYSSNLQQKAQFSQINFGTVTTNSLNGASYQIGDILRLQAASNIYMANNPGWQGSSQNTSTGGSPIVGSSSNGTDVYYEITSAGVVPLNGVRGQYYFENGKMQYSVQNQNSINLNSWNTSGVVSINFNGNSINSSGKHKWIAESPQSTFSFKLYSSQGNEYKNYSWNGQMFGSDIAEVINGTQYENNSILLISSKLTQTGNSKTTLTERGNNNQINNLNVTNQYGYQLTNNGLVPINGNKMLNGVTYQFENGLVVSSANKNDLTNDINTAKAMDMSGYTPDSVTALQNAIKTAEGVASNSNATAQEISDAMTGLQNAIKGLMPNKAGLENA